MYLLNDSTSACPKCFASRTKTQEWEYNENPNPNAGILAIFVACTICRP